ncbi:unnamed protein product, partial [Leptidea sinapis]
SCKAREAVLNKGGQNQMIKLSHWYPDTEYSGCVVTRADKELPAAKSNSNPNNAVPDPGYYDQFLKTTSKSFTEKNSTTNDTESKTTWYELQATDEFSTTEIPDEELWENIGPLKNSTVENLMDGLDVRYKFLMTNGAADDFWHHHFSADEFYVLPILLTYTFAYLLVMVAVVMCSVELRSRHLLHSTYKLFLISIVVQHCGVLMQALAGIRYASNGVGAPYAKVFGQFFCGVSEMTFLLLLLLMAKGYTITRGRLKAGFTVKLTVFMCCYVNMFYCPFFICGTIWFYAGP